jgi:DNA-binding CsgD family transcriptional regulator
MTRSGSRQSDLIGRQPELAVLTAALDDAKAGRGRLVMLAGEPGIGKTRLVQELATLAKASGVQVLWGWCYEGEGAPSYWPWVDSLRTYIRSTEPGLLKTQLGNGAATIGEMVPDVLAILDGIPAAPTMEPDQARFRLFDAITRFLKTASEDTPLLLVIDDLQWADQPSLVLLEFLAQQLDGSRILVAGTYRDTEAPPESPLGVSLARLARMASFQRLPITGLPSEDVGGFVQGETGITPPEQLLSFIHSHTDGNPFFLGEVVRYLAEQGRLDEASENSSGSEDLGVPQGIRDVIGQRLLRLSGPCNLALTTASIIGREFEFDLLAALTESANREELLDLLEEAISARIIEDLPGDAIRYQFRHTLVRQTLNEGISAGRKVQLHARIGEALETAYGENPGDHAAELAHHFTQAVSILGNEQMLRYTLMAGERALASYAHEEAVEHFDRGLGVKGVDPISSSLVGDAQAARLLFGLARAKFALLSFRPGYVVEEAVANLRSAFEYHMQAGDNDRALEIAQSPMRLPVGERAGLADLLEVALGIAPPGSSAKGRLLAAYGYAAGLEEGDFQAAEQAFQEALEIARDNGDGLLMQRILAQAAQVDFYYGRLQDAVGKTRQILTMPVDNLDLETECSARYVYCMSANGIGEPASQPELAAFVTAAEKLGNRLWLHVAYWVSHLGAKLQGDWEKARQFGDQGLAVAPGAPTLLSTMPHTELETGQFDRAEELFQRLSVILADNPVNPTYQYPAAVMVAGMCSWFAETSREPALPSKFVDIVLSSRFACPIFASVTNIGLAYDALVRDDEESCKTAYDALAWLSGQFRAAVVVDRLLGHLAHALGDVPQSIEHFEESLVFCTNAGYKPEYAWTCWGLASALLERGGAGDRQRSDELLAEALQIATDLGMPPLRQRVEILMSQAGKAPAPAYPSGLTRREVEVLLLISGGKTDREIGEELFISIKTVGNHVSNILNKTESANRAEAATFAALNGIVSDEPTT